MASLPSVALITTVSSAPSGAPLIPAEVDVDLVGIGPGEIVDRDGVGTAQSTDIDRFNVVEIHRHDADIAGHADAAAIGRDVDLLVDVGAVELEGVDASLALDDVAAIARVPDEHVVTRAKQRHVTPFAAVDDIVAGAADDLVIAVTAVEREVDLTGVELSTRRWCRCRHRR